MCSTTTFTWIWIWHHKESTLKLYKQKIKKNNVTSQLTSILLYWLGWWKSWKIKNDRNFFIFSPFVFGNSAGKAKGYTLNYYYYYALILVWKLENKYYIFIKDFIQKFIFHVYIIVDSKKKNTNYWDFKM